MLILVLPILINTSNSNEIEQSITANTKAVFIETLTNPLIKLSDLNSIGKIAKNHNILSIVDNTFLTPYLQHPVELDWL